jgi:predicted RNase H-like HicB family nuclease
MTLKAVIHKAAEGGFRAEVPSLPGCLTQGETMDELKAALREAVELWLSVDGEAVESNSADGGSNASAAVIILSSRKAGRSASSFRFMAISRRKSVC